MDDLKKCPTCKIVYELQPDKCDNCGYPFSGTDKDKSHFVAHQVLKKGKISDTRDRIKNARIILFVIAGFNIIVPFFKYSDTDFGGVLIGLSILIGLIFLVFGILAKRKPFISILIPLVLLLVFYLLGFIVEPATLFRGILWKALFIGGLLYGLISIKESEKIKKESNHLAMRDYK
jgi:hypothetical protein